MRIKKRCEKIQKGLVITFEIETIRGRKSDFNEMRMVELTIAAEIIDDGNFLVKSRFVRRLSPDPVSVRTGVLLVFRSPGDQVVAIWCCSERS